MPLQAPLPGMGAVEPCKSCLLQTVSTPQTSAPLFLTQPQVPSSCRGGCQPPAEAGPRRSLQEEAPTFAEEHVPDAQHRAPGQRAREGAHEPLRHVEDGVDLLLAQVLVGHGRDLVQQREEDLPVQLNGLLWGQHQQGPPRPAP